MFSFVHVKTPAPGVQKLNEVTSCISCLGTLGTHEGPNGMARVISQLSLCVVGPGRNVCLGATFPEFQWGRPILPREPRVACKPVPHREAHGSA